MNVTHLKLLFQNSYLLSESLKNISTHINVTVTITIYRMSPDTYWTNILQNIITCSKCCIFLLFYIFNYDVNLSKFRRVIGSFKYNLFIIEETYIYIISLLHILFTYIKYYIHNILYLIIIIRKLTKSTTYKNILKALLQFLYLYIQLYSNIAQRTMIPSQKTFYSYDS